LLFVDIQSNSNEQKHSTTIHANTLITEEKR